MPFSEPFHLKLQIQKHDKMKPFPSSIWLLFPISGMLLTGCASGPASGDPTDLDQPMFGENKDTTFFMNTPSGQMKIRDLAAIARVLRRYKTLEAAEKELIKLAVRRKIDGMVALEARIIEAEPRIVQARKRIATIPDRKVAAVESKKLDEEVLREAARRVADRLANLAAVPVKSAENRSIVAFAKISDGQVQVAANAYEVDAPPGAATAETKVPLPADAVAQLGAPQGSSATTLDTRPVPISAP
jgi:hypothetical protein